MRISDWSSDVCSSDLYGEDGGGALAKFREALALEPGQPRAMQGLAATESAMIRSAEIAAEKGDFDGAKDWLAAAAKVRHAMSTVPDAVARIERLARARARTSVVWGKGRAVRAERGGCRHITKKKKDDQR